LYNKEKYFRNLCLKSVKVLFSIYYKRMNTQARKCPHYTIEECIEQAMSLKDCGISAGNDVFYCPYFELSTEVKPLVENLQQKAGQDMNSVINSS
jgi:hypothetical protein